MAKSYHHGDLRRELLRAAEEELSERGPEGFTLRGCARRAGVSHAAPAHHFGDSGGLLSALAADGFRRFFTMAEARLRAAGELDPRGRLTVLGVGYVQFARENPALFRLMFSSDRPDFNDGNLEGNATASFRQLARAVQDVTGSDPLESLAGQRQVAAMWSVVHGLAHLILSRRMRFLEERDAAELEADVAAIIGAISLVP